MTEAARSLASSQLQFQHRVKFKLWLKALTFLGQTQGIIYTISNAWSIKLYLKDMILSLNVFSWPWELFSAVILSHVLLFRLLCALEGKYLVQQDSSSLMDGAASFTDNEEIQSISFPCSIPDVIGRGFIEVTSLPFLFCIASMYNTFPFLSVLWSEYLNLLVRLIYLWRAWTYD